MKQATWSVVLGALSLGYLFDLLIIGKRPGISLIIFVSLIVAVTLYLARYFGKHVPKQALVLLTPLIFFSAMCFVRDNDFLLVVNLVATLYLLLLFAMLQAISPRKLQTFGAGSYIAVLFWLPIKMFSNFFTYDFTSILASKKPKTAAKHSSLSAVTKGVLLATPVFVVFLALFASADQVFQGLLSSIFDFNIPLPGDLIGHLVVIVLATAVFLGALSYTILKQDSEPERKLFKLPGIGHIEAQIVLGSICALSALFILIQITYLFGGQGHLIATGVTYAEYARKGFFELLVVSVFSLLLILGLDTLSKGKLAGHRNYKWLKALLVGEVLIIMVSALKRLGLYEQAFGYTTSRLIGHLFMFWLALVFVLLLISIFSKRLRLPFASQLFVSLIAFVAMVNLINPDAIVARQNINRFYRTGRIDLVYLSKLSDDAIPVTIHLLDNSDSVLAKSIAHELYITKQARAGRPLHWQSFNLSETAAENVLASHQKTLDENKDYKSTIPTD